MRICVEAGHGGLDPGAVCDHVCEADITAAVARRLAARGYEAKRQPAGLLRLPGLRALLAALHRNEPDVVVSLHCNSSPDDPNRHEATVYYWVGDPNWGRRSASGQLARLLLATLSDPAHRIAEEVTLATAPISRAGGKQLVPGILRYGRLAAVLIEMGFLSDEHARLAMQTAEWQERAAAAIDAGLRGWAERS